MENFFKKENVIIGILIIVIIILIIMNWQKSQKLSRLDETMDNTKSRNKLVLYFTNWCSNCLNFHPIWNSFKENSKTYGFDIDFEEIDCEKNKNICHANNINAYPEVILYKSNGSNIYFNGNRTIDDLRSFVSKNL